MRNCFDCKHKDHKFTNLLSYTEELSFKKKDYVLLNKGVSVSGDHYGRCLSGHNKKFGQFSKKYGKTIRSEMEKRTDLIMDCHEYTDLSLALDKCIAATDKALDYLREKERNGKT
jgi:hypothetical protein